MPDIPHSSRALAARVYESKGWVTEFDFETTAGKRRIRFVISGGWAPLEPFSLGFDFVRIADKNSGGNRLEFGRYLVEVTTDGDVVARFAADAIDEVPHA